MDGKEELTDRFWAGPGLPEAAPEYKRRSRGVKGLPVMGAFSAAFSLYSVFCCVLLRFSKLLNSPTFVSCRDIQVLTKLINLTYQSASKGGCDSGPAPR